MLQEAVRLQDHLQAAIASVIETPGILLSLADAYLFEAKPALRNLSIVQDMETQVQQLGPPLFQRGVAEVMVTLERAEATVEKVIRFTHEVATPLPVSASTPTSEPTKEQTWYAQALDADEKLRIPAGLRYPVPVLRKQKPALKPLNNAYLRLLEGFRELVTGSDWEKRIFYLLDTTKLEQLPQVARELTRAEVAYLHYVWQQCSEPQNITDSYLEFTRRTLSIQWFEVVGCQWTRN